MISIQSLSKSFGQNKALDDVSMELKKGMTYGVVGKNGAGKTTLFKCISGLENYAGTISSELQPLKNHLGFLRTDPYFFSKMTGREYLQLICSARKISGVDFDQNNIFDLPLEQYAERYSTGMQKKLGLLGVLLQENDIFILDEPFNGVDIQSNMIISAIIEKLKVQGKTVLISSHIFSTLSESCDQIFLLDQGKITDHVSRENFAKLEQSMRDFSIGEKLDGFLEV